MPGERLAAIDDGRINQRILAREAKRDFLAQVESARRKLPTTFYSPEVKRLFLRCFDSMQLNAHFISVIARIRLAAEMVEKVEASIREQIEKQTAEVNKAIDGAEALFKANGITSLAEYDAPPLAIDVRVISALGRRYLELICKVDQLMPMLETLAIDEVITQQELDVRKAMYKRTIKRVVNTTRALAGGLRRRMNALDRPQNSSEEVSGQIALNPEADSQGAEHGEMSSTKKPQDEFRIVASVSAVGNLASVNEGV